MQAHAGLVRAMREAATMKAIGRGIMAGASTITDGIVTTTATFTTNELLNSGSAKQQRRRKRLGYAWPVLLPAVA